MRSSITHSPASAPAGSTQKPVETAQRRPGRRWAMLVRGGGDAPSPPSPRPPGAPAPAPAPRLPSTEPCWGVVVRRRAPGGPRVFWGGPPPDERNFIVKIMPGGQPANLASDDYSHFGFALSSRAAADDLARRAEVLAAWSGRRATDPIRSATTAACAIPRATMWSSATASRWARVPRRCRFPDRARRRRVARARLAGLFARRQQRHARRQLWWGGYPHSRSPPTKTPRPHPGTRRSHRERRGSVSLAGLVEVFVAEVGRLDVTLSAAAVETLALEL